MTLVDPDPASAQAEAERSAPPIPLLGRSVWTDQELADAGIPILDVPLVSVGGGLGSLALIGLLRQAGADPSQLGVVTSMANPVDTYRYLAANSQIDRDDRLRSDAGSVMDNIWGFPSYAWREAWSDRSLKPLATVATEPLVAEYFTPKAGQVYDSVDREIARLELVRPRSRGHGPGRAPPSRRGVLRPRQPGRG